MNHRLDGVAHVPLRRKEPEPKCVDCGVVTSDYDAAEPDWEDGLWTDGQVLHSYSDGTHGCEPCSNGGRETSPPPEGYVLTGVKYT